MKKILIIEDDAAIAELELDYLEAADFAVTRATDGESGCQLAMENDFDLILLDLMLPKKDGFAVCREIRAKKNVPILMVSARREDIDKIRGLGLGADDYLTKPFSPSELVARVKAHIKRYERLTGKKDTLTLNCDNLEIQPEAMRVFIDGREVTLTNKEFELLLFLAKNDGIVLSKEKILERVWGFDAISDTATVTVHINRLREKIEKNPTHPFYIETVWGAGYRFKKFS